MLSCILHHPEYIRIGGKVIVSPERYLRNGFGKMVKHFLELLKGKIVTLHIVAFIAEITGFFTDGGDFPVKDIWHRKFTRILLECLSPAYHKPSIQCYEVIGPFRMEDLDIGCITHIYLISISGFYTDELPVLRNGCSSFLIKTTV